MEEVTITIPNEEIKQDETITVASNTPEVKEEIQIIKQIEKHHEVVVKERTTIKAKKVDAQKEEKKQRDLTIKERRWRKAYLDCGNATEAAKIAGYNCSSREGFAQIGYENLRKLDFSDLMEDGGLTDQYLHQKLSEGLDANRTISVKGGKEASANTDDFIDIPDYLTRHKYLETALKLKKRLNDKAILGGDKNEPIFIKFVEDTKETEE